MTRDPDGFTAAEICQSCSLAEVTTFAVLLPMCLLGAQPSSGCPSNIHADNLTFLVISWLLHEIKTCYNMQKTP